MSRAKVVINLADGSGYDVRIGPGVITTLGATINDVIPSATHAVVISDTNVAPLYGPAVKEQLSQAGLRVTEITLPAGEQSKSVDVLSELWEALSAQRISRDACVVGLGGGVVGDLAGFVAATYMRGIAFVHVPTSLLAMVDASVGGKTGINLSTGKNIVGAFKQPVYVCADTSTLETLPEREWLCGFAEVAKTAVLDSDEFFFWLTEHAEALRAHSLDVVQEAIVRCVVFKANVVAADETEQGMRACLNYGHTLGHALEQVLGYGTISHGAAVAEGMRFAARLSAAQTGASLEFVQAQDDLLDALGLDALSCTAETEQICNALYQDKKVRAGQLRFVLVDDIGSWQVVPVDEALVREHVDAWVRSK